MWKIFGVKQWKQIRCVHRNIEKEWKMRNKLFKETDKHEEKQGSGIKRKNEMKERSYKDRHAGQ